MANPPSVLSTVSSNDPATSATGTVDPIPTTEPSAASPLPDRGQRRKQPNWWPLALLLVVLAGIGIAAAARNGDSGARPSEAPPVTR